MSGAPDPSPAFGHADGSRECRPLIEPIVIETGKLGATYTIPMILHCPACSGRHIDEGEFANVPHHTHACQHCGLVWRPAKVNTHGVQFLPGYSNAAATAEPAE
jgi:rubredoxin